MTFLLVYVTKIIIIDRYIAHIAETSKHILLVWYLMLTEGKKSRKYVRGSWPHYAPPLLTSLITSHSSVLTDRSMDINTHKKKGGGGCATYSHNGMFTQNGVPSGREETEKTKGKIKVFHVKLLDRLFKQRVQRYFFFFFCLSAQRSVMAMIIPLPHYDFFFLETFFWSRKKMPRSPPPPPRPPGWRKMIGLAQQ